jgi:hypothetical protein
MSAASARARLDAATDEACAPVERYSAALFGWYPVHRPDCAYERSGFRLDPVPVDCDCDIVDRQNTRNDLIAHAPTDLRLALDVVEAVGQMRDELFPWFPDEADLPDVALVGRSVLKPILDAFLAAEAAP